MHTAMVRECQSGRLKFSAIEPRFGDLKIQEKAQFKCILEASQGLYVSRIPLGKETSQTRIKHYNRVTQFLN
jgi:hypothetical protein